MRHLIIPDVHEQYLRLLELEPKIQEADRVVLLGDFGDSFKNPGRRLHQTYSWVKERLDDPKFTILIGNHDVHYYFSNSAYLCSGFKWDSKRIVQDIIKDADVRKMHIYTEAGNYTISHAGFNINTIQYKRPEIEREAIESSLAGKYDPIFGAGHARGGNLPFGGPTWLDWNKEFEPINEMPQIVGHTNGLIVRTKKDGRGLISYCIDTGLRHCAIVDDETNSVTIEEV